MEERMIPKEWVERAVDQPVLRNPDPDDPQVERFFRPIRNRTTGSYVLP